MLVYSDFLYDDRIEITSPESMIGGKRIQEVDILHVPSLRRNPVISDIFHRLKYMERRGSGIKKILKEYEEENLPEFFSDQQYFIVTLKNKNYAESYKVNENFELENRNEDTRKSSEKGSEKTSEKILQMIAADKNVTTSAIAKAIGISSRAVEKQISKLKEQGSLKRVGADKGGHWEIISEN